MKCAIRVAAAVALASSTVFTQDKTDDGGKEGLILDKSETIAFTTDEGTWMSLAVSPDGRTIAFDLLGDIYTLPIEGGQARGSSAEWRSTASRRSRRMGRRLPFSAIGAVSRTCGWPIPTART